MPRAPRTPKPGDPQVIDVLAEQPTEQSTTQVVNPPVAQQPVDHRPVPESELTPDQRRIRELEDRLAKELGRKDPDVELAAPAQPGAEGNILIHFLEDGFTVLGQVWYRGQELEFEPGSPAHQDTYDRTGRSWLDLRNDEFAQAARWGKVMFRNGPWPGKSLAEAAEVPYEALRPIKEGAARPAAPSEAELVAAGMAEAKRRRAAPRLSDR